MFRYQYRSKYPLSSDGWFLQNGGTARHDAVAWGYARAADSYGVDIIQNCELHEIIHKKNKITGVVTSKGKINTKKLGVVVAGHSSVVADKVGIKLPIQSRPLQALVSEPIKPILDTVIMSNAVHMYISQSDKGEMVLGAGVDKYNSYGQKGSFPVTQHMIASCDCFQFFQIKMLRHWGIVEHVLMLLIISKTSEVFILIV